MSTDLSHKINLLCEIIGQAGGAVENEERLWGITFILYQAYELPNWDLVQKYSGWATETDFQDVLNEAREQELIFPPQGDTVLTLANKKQLCIDKWSEAVRLMNFVEIDTLKKIRLKFIGATIKSSCIELHMMENVFYDILREWFPKLPSIADLENSAKKIAS
jgi:hypothetical protein